MEMKKIGGQRLRELGSDRHTLDVDYLIYDDTNTELFITAPESDLINAARNNMLAELWEAEKDNDEISLNGLAVLCGWAFINHCQNGNFRKADAKEYDLKFLARISPEPLDLTILKKYAHAGEFSEVEKIIASIRN